MTDQEATRALSAKLCPWLVPALERLERAISVERLAHGWLLAGPKGIGKINLALVLARRILESAPRTKLPAELTPTEAAAAMRRRHKPFDHHPDLHWVYPEEDKRSISVEQIRSVTGLLALSSHQGGGKVLIVEPAEAMTVGAANALLKTLEEPTADTYLLLVSHQPGRLPATIRSRCQTLVLRAPQAGEIGRWLGTATSDREAVTELGPLQQIEETDKDLRNELIKIYDNINLISTYKLDPQAVAERWLKTDLDRLLDALARRIQQAIRGRFTAKDSNPVTDLPATCLHNAWPALTLRTLFEQLLATERLRDQVGRGANTDLAVRALLMGFNPPEE